MGGYDRDWLLAWLNKEDFAEQLAYAAQAEIIREPTAWNWKEAHDGIQITNPFMNTLARGQAPWEAYEEVLQRVQALYHDSQFVIADAHSGNLMPCVLEGRVQGHSVAEVRLTPGPQYTSISSWPGTVQRHIVEEVRFAPGP